jgi:hypothetical protein
LGNTHHAISFRQHFAALPPGGDAPVLEASSVPDGPGRQADGRQAVRRPRPGVRSPSCPMAEPARRDGHTRASDEGRMHVAHLTNNDEAAGGRDACGAGRLNALAQPEKGQDHEDDHNEADEVDNIVHTYLLCVGSRQASRLPPRSPSHPGLRCPYTGRTSFHSTAYLRHPWRRRGAIVGERQGHATTRSK